jgi:hypothetical protein
MSNTLPDTRTEDLEPPVQDPPPVQEPPPVEEPAKPEPPGLKDEPLVATASALTELINLMIAARKTVLDAFTPTTGARLTAMASDHFGLADSVAFVAPHLTLAGNPQGKAHIATETLDGLQQYLGSQYKVANLSPTALAEQLSNEPRLMAHLRALAPTLDALKLHPVVAKAIEEAEASGSSTVTVHADSLRDYLTGS